MSLIERLGLSKIRAALPAARTLRVYLGPQVLNSVMLRNGRELPGSARSTLLDNPGGDWQASADALAVLLRQSSESGPAPALEISLHGRWCQMVLAPWSDALLSPPDAARFLQTQLAAVYGDPARSWEITADDAPYGSPRIVCGTDALLIQSLKTLAQEHGCRCRAIEPALGTVLRARPASGAASRTALPAPPATPPRRRLLARGAAARAIALIEAGRITMAAIEGGRITAIQSQPCGGVWQLELPQAWQRWTLRAPELAAIDSVAVFDLNAAMPRIALAPPALPSRFHLVDSPFGSPETPAAAAREAA